MTRASQGIDEETAEVFRLLYRSRSRILPEDRRSELGALFTTARSNNKRRGISGALLVADDWFVQALEGDEGTVRELFGRIELDPRHESVAVLSSLTVPGRVFARWAMAEVGAEGQPDTPLIAHEDGISPAASRGTTPEQELVLADMRAAAEDVSSAR